LLFSSIFFLYIFLPASILLVVLGGKRLRNILLLFFSLIFLAWGGVSNALILPASIIVNYFAGMLISRSIGSRKARIFLFAGILFNIGLLIGFKYLNFFADSINTIFYSSAKDGIHLKRMMIPLAISYYTFHCISYLIDIYRENITVQKNIIRFSLYVSFFPKLIAGPIVRYNNMAEQLSSKKLSLFKFAAGAERFVIGLGKKVLLANTFALLADKMFAMPIAEHSLVTAWAGIISYTLQIYFDFSAYSDMAIGLGKIFGFDFPENFNFPYIAKSIQEFWQRWHISLSSWLRDYIFAPLSIKSRNMGKAGIAISLLITFGICGLWHGPSWTYVLWGLGMGFFLALENVGFSKVLKKLWSPLRHLYVLIIVIFGWVLFRSDTLEYAKGYFHAMFGFGTGINKYAVISFYVTREFHLCLLIAIIGSTRFFPIVREQYSKIMSRLTPKFGGAIDTGVLVLELLGIIFIMVSSTMYLITSAYNPFIYFRF